MADPPSDVVVSPVKAGRREAERVPLLILAALVVSVVADAAKAAPFVRVQIIEPMAVVIVQSPEAVKPPKPDPVLY